MFRTPHSHRLAIAGSVKGTSAALGETVKKQRDI
jgi:hypothetical protein